MGPQVALAKAGKAPLSPLGSFVDSLVQTFENCRNALDDARIAEGSGSVTHFFAELYDKETSRLDEHLRVHETHLGPGQAAALRKEVDEMIRQVVIPAYVRLAMAYTPRERNEFFIAPKHLHTAERVAWVVGGLLLGIFIVLAPFIPLWAEEWILVFCVLGMFYPRIRKVLAMREYENDLNELVRKTDRELDRIDAAYLTKGIGLDDAQSGAEAEDELSRRRREADKEKEGN